MGTSIPSTDLSSPRRRARSTHIPAIATVSQACPPQAGALPYSASNSLQTRQCWTPFKMQPSRGFPSRSDPVVTSNTAVGRQRLIPVSQLVAEADMPTRSIPRTNFSVLEPTLPSIRSNRHPMLQPQVTIPQTPLWGLDSSPRATSSPLPPVQPSAEVHSSDISPHNMSFELPTEQKITQSAPAASRDSWPTLPSRQESAIVGEAGGPHADVKQYAKLLTPFIYKLYSLVADDDTNGLCEWTNQGTAFVVHDPVAFSAKILPLYFKHNQFSSFVRQLNKYSFHKLTPGAFLFGHTQFVKNRPDLLLRIGPPRPQERGGDKQRHSGIKSGGAPLSSLQRDNLTYQQEESNYDSRERRTDSAISPNEAVRQGSSGANIASAQPETFLRTGQPHPGSLTVPTEAARQAPDEIATENVISDGSRIPASSSKANRISDQNNEVVSKAYVEEIVSQVQQQFSGQLRQELSQAHAERSNLFCRLNESEGRVVILEREVYNLKQRIIVLEQSLSMSPPRKRQQREG